MAHHSCRPEETASIWKGQICLIENLAKGRVLACFHDELGVNRHDLMWPFLGHVSLENAQCVGHGEVIDTNSEHPYRFRRQRWPPDRPEGLARRRRVRPVRSDAN